EDLIQQPMISLGASPNAVAITPSGSMAYVVSQENDEDVLQIIDVACNQEIKEKKLSLAITNPTVLVISPDGARAYLANGQQLQVIDTSTNRALGGPFNLIDDSSNESPINALALSPDGRRLYVTNLFTQAGTNVKQNRIQAFDMAKLEQQVV